MTVKELRKKLENFDDNKQVVFYLGMRDFEEDVFTSISNPVIREDLLEEGESIKDFPFWEEHTEEGAVCFDLDY